MKDKFIKIFDNYSNSLIVTNNIDTTNVSFRLASIVASNYYGNILWSNIVNKPNTDLIPEGFDNRYFTEERARDALSSTVVSFFNNDVGYAVTASLTTANVIEVGNLYYSNARVYGNVSQLNFATNSQLGIYATNNQLSIYATNTQLASYATNAQIANFITDSSLSGYATNNQLTVYATNTQLGAYATNAQLGVYATNSQLGSYATNAQLSSYVQTGADLSIFNNNVGYVTSSQLVGYATNGQLTAYVTNAQISNFITSSALSGYATNAQIASAVLFGDDICSKI